MPTGPGPRREIHETSSDRRLTDPEVEHGGDGEREVLAAALDAVVEVIVLAHDQLRLASPATRALIAEHASWPENFRWTDGSQVAQAARQIAGLLRKHPASAGPSASGRRRSRARRDR